MRKPVVVLDEEPLQLDLQGCLTRRQSLFIVGIQTNQSIEQQQHDVALVCVYIRFPGVVFLLVSL